MKFDATITLGTIVQIGSMVVLAVACYYAISGRMDIFSQVLKSHTESLTTHADRLDKHEDRILDLVSGLQRLIGKTDIVFRQHGRKDE